MSVHLQSSFFKKIFRCKSRSLFFTISPPLSILILSCAAIQPPSGGPKDTTPPAILSVTPPSASLQFKGGKINIQFSEYMNESSLEKGIKVFPRLEKPVGMKFRGESIILNMTKKLAPDQTYVISLSRDVQDEHGVPLERSIQLAYSTGNKIDLSKISGKVVNDNKSAVHLWKINPDTRRDSVFAGLPDYITDVADDGSYQFGFLSPGEYRVLAITRSASGLPLDTKRMAYGLPWLQEITIDTAQIMDGINILSRQEPQPLRLLRGDWVSSGWGRLYFNNTLPQDSLVVDLTVSQTDGKRLPTGYFIDPVDAKNIVVLLKDSITAEYLIVEINSIKLNGNILLDSSRINVRVPASPDTSYLELVQPKKKSILTPGKGTEPALELMFSQPLTAVDTSNGNLKLFRNDTITVKSQFTQINSMLIRISPVFPWESNNNYHLQLLQAGFTAANGRTFKDSLLVLKIATDERIGYGGLMGSVEISSGSQLIAKLSSVENSEKNFTSVVNSKAQFVLTELPEGEYSLMIFEDQDFNQEYTYGKAYPFTPAEWFMTYPDTIEIRANWDTNLDVITLEEKP